MIRQFVGGGLIFGTLFVVGTWPAEARHLSAEPPTCTCSASLGFAAPDLQFQNSVLTFIPRVNVSLRSHGSVAAPAWTASVVYSGKTSFASDDISPPAGGEFSGSQDVAHGPCGSRFSLRGVQLTPVPLNGLTRTLLGHREELEGTVAMAAEVHGCGFDTEKKLSRFTLKEFGNLVVRGWRTVR